MNLSQLFEQLIAGHHLSTQQIQAFMQACIQGQLSDAQIATFLALIRMKGETVDELTAATTVLLQSAHQLDLGDQLIDLVGTGGDQKNTFNVSTVSSFVAAAAGARVAKHGNRSVSSRSGSADLLEQAGFKLNLSDTQLQTCMQQCGICFLFAPHFHQAMLKVRSARQQLGIRTFFNLLGPLLNPARVSRLVLGVYALHWLEPLAKVLANLGCQHALLIHSRDGLDEISISAPTDVVEYYQGAFTRWSIDPKDYDCFHPKLDAIIVDSPAQSLQLAESVLNGEKGAARDIILLNSAAALYCAELAPSFGEAIVQAQVAIDSEDALNRFDALRRLTQDVARSL